jgi:hypothetical protein
MYERARMPAERAQAIPLSVDDLRSALDAVRIEGPDPFARTVWCSLYDLGERSLTIDFYLGEAPGGGQLRSAPLTYTLALEAAA